MIGTHNSCTGERGKGILSFLLTPFARCQTKTIKEQYEAGCRFFDLRTRIEHGEFIVAHGPWVCKRKLFDVLDEISAFPEQCWVAITYEGAIDDVLWYGICSMIADIHKGLKFGWYAIKKPLHMIYVNESMMEYKQGYVGISKENGNRWMPVPIFWKLLRYRNQVVDKESDVLTIIDFL